MPTGPETGGAAVGSETDGRGPRPQDHAKAHGLGSASAQSAHDVSAAQDAAERWRSMAQTGRRVGLPEPESRCPTARPASGRSRRDGGRVLAEEHELEALARSP